MCYFLWLLPFKTGMMYYCRVFVTSLFLVACPPKPKTFRAGNGGMRAATRKDGKGSVE